MLRYSYFLPSTFRVSKGTLLHKHPILYHKERIDIYLPNTKGFM